MRLTLSPPSVLHLPLVFLPLALTFLSFGPQDDQGQKAPPKDGPQLERDIFGRLQPKTKGQDSALEGVWQLLDVNIDGYPKPGLQALGFMLIQDGHIAFQLEAYWEEDDYGEAPQDGYQAFVAEFVRTGNTLSCTTLMGAYLDEEEDDYGEAPQDGYQAFVAEFVRTDNTLSCTTLIAPESDPDIFGRDEKKRDDDKKGDDDGKP